MGEAMWVTATVTLPTRFPVEVLTKPRSEWTEDFEDYVESRELTDIECWTDAEVFEYVGGRTFRLAGSYNYGLTGFNDAIGFESTCRERRIAYVVSDDGGKYEKGTWTCYLPRVDNGVDCTLRADSDGKPVIDTKAWAEIRRSSLLASDVIPLIDMIFSI